MNVGRGSRLKTKTTCTPSQCQSEERKPVRWGFLDEIAEKRYQVYIYRYIFVHYRILLGFLVPPPPLQSGSLSQMSCEMSEYLFRSWTPDETAGWGHLAATWALRVIVG